MNYQLQQLIYEFLVFWNGQYNGDYHKICKMVYVSLQNHFNVDLDDVNSQINFDKLLLDHNYINIYTAFRRDSRKGEK